MKDRGKLYTLSAPASAADVPPAEVLRLRREAAEYCMIYAFWAELEPEQDTYSEPAYTLLRQRLIRLGALGVEPVLCLYHGEMPDWFRVRGGWEQEDNLRHFLRYVGKTVRSTGHLVSRFVTVCEPDALLRAAAKTPGARLRALNALSHMLGGHVRAYRLIHDTRSQRSLDETSVGFVMRLRSAGPVRRRFLGEASLLQTEILRAMALGKFTPPLLNPLHIRPGDWCDFIAVTADEGSDAEALRQETEIITGKPACIVDR